MNNVTIQQFGGEMARLWGAYGKPAPTNDIISVYYDGLRAYEASDVQRAFKHFILLASHSGWPPALPQVLNEMPSAPQRVDMAYLRSQLIKPTTTVGALACAAVGSHDRKMMGDPSAERSITAKLTAFINELPAMTKEITEGRGYNRDQIAILKSGRYPNINHSEFAGVAIQPHTMLENKKRASLMLERGQLSIEAQPTEPTDKTAKMHPSISAKLAALAADLDTAEPEIIKNELTHCTNCHKNYEVILNACSYCGEHK